MLLNQGGFPDFWSMHCHLGIFQCFYSNFTIMVCILNLLTQIAYLGLLHIWWYYSGVKMVNRLYFYFYNITMCPWKFKWIILLTPRNKCNNSPMQSRLYCWFPTYLQQTLLGHFLLQILGCGWFDYSWAVNWHSRQQHHCQRNKVCLAIFRPEQCNMDMLAVGRFNKQS